jgi:methyltransferase (TIGR00027 family)
LRIHHISETARWVALYRAMETERRDALFHDPYARRLAGAWDEKTLAKVAHGRAAARPMVVRTVVFDEILLGLLRGESERPDLVLNLAAGLDTRPYRLDLPSELHWVEVDLPEILAYKEELLASEPARCLLERVALDLRDENARRALFDRLGSSRRSVLVLTEGLLVYLTREHVAALGADLHRPESFRFWVTDLASPQLLKWMKRTWSPSLAGGVTFQFAPEEGPAFFESSGWREKRYVSMADEARRLKREMPMAPLFRLLARFLSAEKRKSFRRFVGTVLLER